MWAGSEVIMEGSALADSILTECNTIKGGPFYFISVSSIQVKTASLTHGVFQAG